MHAFENNLESIRNSTIVTATYSQARLRWIKVFKRVRCLAYYNKTIRRLEEIEFGTIQTETVVFPLRPARVVGLIATDDINTKVFPPQSLMSETLLESFKRDTMESKMSSPFLARSQKYDSPLPPIQNHI